MRPPPQTHTDEGMLAILPEKTVSYFILSTMLATKVKQQKIFFNSKENLNIESQTAAGATEDLWNLDKIFHC